MSDRPEFSRLVTAMEQVLDRCVWSQTMTHASLLTYLIEESYELVDAVESGDADDIREELADVLLQVVFHSAIASREPSGSVDGQVIGAQGLDEKGLDERGLDEKGLDTHGFDVEDVARAAADKMIRRHPHVFAGVEAPTVEDVLRVWSAAKAEEKAQRESIMDGLPSALPALALAAKTVGRIDRGAASVPIPDEPSPADEAELGRLLLGIAAASSRAGLDPERALRRAVTDLQASVRSAESSTARDRSSTARDRSSTARDRSSTARDRSSTTAREQSSTA